MHYFGTNIIESGHYRWNVTNEGLRNRSLKFDDLPFHPEYLTSKLAKGKVIYYQGGGFTVIGISGSCKDERPGTKTIFWIQEKLSKEQMIKKITDNIFTKEILDAMPFEIQWFD